MGTVEFEIVRIPMGKSNIYLLRSDQTAIMIDAGSKKKTDAVSSALGEKGLDLKEIGLVILTHSHYDHVLGANGIKQRSGAKILAHESEKPFLLKGFTPFPKGTGIFSRIISGLGNTVLKNTGKYTPVEPDILVSDDYSLSDYGLDGLVISTPGHTSGSLSIIVGGKAAFVGDTMFNIFGNTVYPPFADDEEKLLKSWERLIQTGCEEFYPGHGKPFGMDKLMETYKRHKS